MRTVVALFDRFEDAQQAVQALHDAGFLRDDINMIARDVNGDYTRYLDENPQGATQDVSDGAAAGAGAGAILGGLGGLLVGLGALAIAGIGPVLAAGPIVTALAGAGVGALAGGLIGALVDLGIPEEHANIYAEGVRRGGTLVVVRTQDAQAEQARAILNRFNPVDIENRSQTWRDNHWTGFDQNNQELTADQMEFNRSSAAMPVTGSEVNRDMNRDVNSDLTLDQQTDTTSQQAQNQDRYTTGMGSQNTASGDWNQSGTMGSGSSTQSNQDMDRSGSGDIPVTGDQSRQHDHMGDSFDSGMDQHLTDDVYSAERSHDEIVDIPVTGARMDSENVEEVDVTPIDWDSYDPIFQRDYQTRYGSTGYGYDYYQPAYRYGYDLASDPRFEGYDWVSLEPVARQNWQRRGLSGAWDDVKDAVRRAWETVTNR